MGVVGTLLKNRRAGEAKLAWNLPNLSAPETLVLTSDAFADGEAIPAENAGKRAGGREPGCGGTRAALRHGTGVLRPGTDQGPRLAPLRALTRAALSLPCCCWTRTFRCRDCADRARRDRGRGHLAAWALH